MEVLLSLILGIVVGIVSSFLGIGGGILIVPLLPSFTGISANSAVATSLAIVSLVAIKNVISFNKKKLVKFSAGINIGLGAFVGSFISAQFVADLSEKVVVGILGSVLLFLAYRIIFVKKPQIKSKVTENKFNYKALIAGVICGLIVGVTGLGGGILFGPLLLGFHMVREEEMSPTSNLAMIFSCVAGVIGFIIHADHFNLIEWGLIRIDLALMAFIGAFFSSKLGKKYQHLMSTKLRRGLLVSLILLVLFKTLYRVLVL